MSGTCRPVDDARAGACAQLLGGIGGRDYRIQQLGNLVFAFAPNREPTSERPNETRRRRDEDDDRARAQVRGRRHPDRSARRRADRAARVRVQLPRHRRSAPAACRHHAAAACRERCEQVAVEAAERRDPPRARGAGRPGIAAVGARPAPLGNPPRLGARVDRDARDPPPRPAGRRRRGHDRRCLGARRNGGGGTLLGDRGGARERFATLDRAHRQSSARAGRDPEHRNHEDHACRRASKRSTRGSERPRARAPTRVHPGTARRAASKRSDCQSS